MKITHFPGDLTDIAAEKEPLVVMDVDQARVDAKGQQFVFITKAS